MKYLLKIRVLVVAVILLILLPDTFAQTLDDYELQGAKLGRKIGQQISESFYEHTPSNGRVETLFGLTESDYKGNQRLTSFVGAMDGAVVGSLARHYSYQHYYQGNKSINYRKRLTDSNDISTLEIANITYADEDEDGMLSKNEEAQIYFDLINTGEKPLFGITPVLMADKTKHIHISNPYTIDTLEAQHALRYVIILKGDGFRSPGKVKLMLRIKYGQGRYYDVEQIWLGSKRKKCSPVK